MWDPPRRNMTNTTGKAQQNISPNQHSASSATMESRETGTFKWMGCSSTTSVLLTLCLQLTFDKNHPHANADDSMDIAREQSTKLAEDVQWKAKDMTQQHAAHLTTEFHKGHKHLPQTFRQPIRTMFDKDTVPIDSMCIKKQTEKLLWHQRSGCPCNECLCNASKAICGVPEFKSVSAVLDTCPTCIRAKQTKAR